MIWEFRTNQFNILLAGDNIGRNKACVGEQRHG